MTNAQPAESIKVGGLGVWDDGNHLRVAPPGGAGGVLRRHP
jgi:hypothetical protein